MRVPLMFAMILLSIASYADGAVPTERGDEGVAEVDVGEQPAFQRSRIVQVPDKASVNRAVDLMVELCGDDVKMVTSGKITNVQFAGKLLELCRKTDDMSLKFVLIRNAIRQLVQANQFERAQELIFKTVDKFGGYFAAGMVEQSKTLIDKKAVNGKSDMSVAALQSVVRELNAAISEVEEAELALKRVSANFNERKRLALNSAIIGNWFEALSAYAMVDGPQGTIAKWELAYPEGGDECTAEKVGDKWWDMAEGKDESGLAFHSLTSHAAFWYRKALDDGKMDELKIAVVKKRLSQSIGGPAEQINTEKSTSEAKDSSTRKCYRCKGTGEIVINTKAKCTRCNGTGVVVGRVTLTNKKWAEGGSSWYNTKIKSANTRKTCPDCGRMGKVNVKKTITCPVCKGK